MDLTKKYIILKREIKKKKRYKLREALKNAFDIECIPSLFLVPLKDRKDVYNCNNGCEECSKKFFKQSDEDFINLLKATIEDIENKERCYLFSDTVFEGLKCEHDCKKCTAYLKVADKLREMI